MSAGKRPPAGRSAQGKTAEQAWENFPDGLFGDLAEIPPTHPVELPIDPLPDPETASGQPQPVPEQQAPEQNTPEPKYAATPDAAPDMAQVTGGQAADNEDSDFSPEFVVAHAAPESMPGTMPGGMMPEGGPGEMPGSMSRNIPDDTGQGLPGQIPQDGPRHDWQDDREREHGPDSDHGNDRGDGLIHGSLAGDLAGRPADDLADDFDQDWQDDKVSPERLELRAAPQRITRISRRALAVGGSILGGGLAVALVLALDPPRISGGEEPREVYGNRNKAIPGELDRLPKAYTGPDFAPPPRIGAPLPGDLGDTVVDVERDLGIDPAAPPLSPVDAGVPFRPDPEADAARAARIRKRQKEAEARESDVMFQIGAKGPGSTDRSGSGSDSAGRAGDPGLDPLLAALAGGGVGSGDTDNTGGSGSANGEAARQDAHRRGFLENRTDVEAPNPNMVQDPVSAYQLMAGTVISASLITGLNSGLPGISIAQVTEHVYDSVTGQHLLVPQGSRLIGRYDSLVTAGQERLLVIWQRLIMPDGSSVVVNNLPGTDAAGQAGLADKVDFHFDKLAIGAGLATLIAVGTALAFDRESEDDVGEAVRRALQQTAGRTSQRLIDRNINIPPTITIRPGWPVRVLVNKDLVLRPYRGARIP